MADEYRASWQDKRDRAKQAAARRKRAEDIAESQPRTTTPSSKVLAQTRAAKRVDRTTARGKELLNKFASELPGRISKANKTFGENIKTATDLIKRGAAAAPGFVAERNKRFGENVSAIGKTIKGEVDRAIARNPSTAKASMPAQIPADKGDNTLSSTKSRTPVPGMRPLVRPAPEAAKKATSIQAKAKPKAVTTGEASNRSMPGNVYVGKDAAPLPKSDSVADKPKTGAKTANGKAKFYQGVPLPRGAAARMRAMNRAN